MCALHILGCRLSRALINFHLLPLKCNSKPRKPRSISPRLISHQNSFSFKINSLALYKSYLYVLDSAGTLDKCDWLGIRKNVQNCHLSRVFAFWNYYAPEICGTVGSCQGNFRGLPRKNNCLKCSKDFWNQKKKITLICRPFGTFQNKGIKKNANHRSAELKCINARIFNYEMFVVSKISMLLQELVIFTYCKLNWTILQYI